MKKCFTIILASVILASAAAGCSTKDTSGDTVGYGDVYPITAAGKILATIIAFLGIGLVAVPTGIITAGFTEIVDNNKDKENDKVSLYHFAVIRNLVK